MTPQFTIIYAFRDRDSGRVKNSLLSLKNQKERAFNVLFVDYGSVDTYAKPIQELVNTFSFVDYHYVGHKGLLWNKSKAINFGVLKATTDYIFIADVDLLFTSNFSQTILELLKPKQFSLFKIGYLPESITTKDIENSSINTLQPKHYGDTFGVGLFTKKMLQTVGGLDPFFHFYGSEDEDLNARLIANGFTLNRYAKNLLLHQWHERYHGKQPQPLTITPRLSNVLRLNQRHYLREKEVNKPNRTLDSSIFYSKQDYLKLKKPFQTIEIDNVEAKVIHLLNYELPLYKGQIVKLVFKESQYYNSLKYRIKKQLKKQTQPYLSMKTINDLVLQKIVFQYRDFNYSYKVHDNLKQITLSIELHK